MPFNTTAKNLALDALDETAAGTVGITHVGVATSALDPGKGTNSAGTEATGGSPAYARLAATWGAAASELKSNTNTFTFDVPAGTYAYFLLFNAITGNTSNYRGFIPFGGAAAIKGFFSVDTTLTNDQFRSVAHGLADGDRVILYGAFSEALPTGTGLTAGALLFVVGSTADTFKVSLTSGGAAIDLTATGGGEGYFQKVVPEVFAAQGQITVAAGALVLDASGF
jgi:hypothetical protein